jgi:hypothetical protein
VSVRSESATAFIQHIEDRQRPFKANFERKEADAEAGRQKVEMWHVFRSCV